MNVVARRRLVTVLVVSLVLAGCPPPTFLLRLASPAPSFTIEEPGQSRPRYTDADVVRGGDTVWAIRAEPFGDGASPATLTYGSVPPGFVETVPAAPLVSGTYRLAVRGLSVEGSLFFAVDGDGGVREVVIR